jgi:hypothetical protein
MNRRALTFSLVVLVGLALVGYGLFEARRLIEGPQITIDSPSPGSATSSAQVVIVGTAQNISFLTINDSPAYTDEEGHFRAVLSPPPGYTTLVVAAVDRFGRRAKKIVSINVLTYCPTGQAHHA